MKHLIGSRRGYVHWLIPLLCLIFFFGYIISSLIRSRLMSALALIFMGAVSGHLLIQRKRVHFISGFLLVLGLFVGYILAEKLLSNMVASTLFFISCAVAFVAEKGFAE